ncbi:MAG: flagellar basal body rod protein FlgB [Bacillota bacterium]
MIDKLFNGKKIVHTALDAAWLRNKAIAENIANVNTPGYKRTIVTFEEQLNNAIQTIEPKNNKPESERESNNRANNANVSIKVEKDHSSSMRRDGNNVDIDVEMAENAKNTIKYNALLKRAGYSSLRVVLTDTK